ncbi:hypothetical protein B0H17DRAFT_1230719 [Mycena rosella]|uniref:Uncharacterized protein n=1 Tax=Mycena rosella TaxID=1033263 RepID=A0AAD7GC91_MYCRO|nr:hypothetical protein B0H17DRAFT_1230719 [Mycena rosella]
MYNLSLWRFQRCYKPRRVISEVIKTCQHNGWCCSERRVLIEDSGLEYYCEKLINNQPQVSVFEDLVQSSARPVARTKFVGCLQAVATWFRRKFCETKKLKRSSCGGGRAECEICLQSEVVHFILFPEARASCATDEMDRKDRKRGHGSGPRQMGDSATIVIGIKFNTDARRALPVLSLGLDRKGTTSWIRPGSAVKYFEGDAECKFAPSFPS